MRFMHLSVRTICGLLFVILIASLSTSASEKKLTRKEVPRAVLNAFVRSYPKAVIKGYAKEVENGGTFFELESVDGRTRRDVLYTPEGEVSEIEETVVMNDLPDAVKKAFAKESDGKAAARVEKTTRGEKVVYEFTMGKGKTEMVIAPDGAIVEHSQVNTKKDKEENGKGKKED